MMIVGILVISILIAFVIGFACNSYLMPKPVLNFMLMDMAFSATFSNMVPEERLERIMNSALFRTFP